MATPTYQVVNATDLNAAIGATANAIRTHTGDSSKIAWNATTGFASAINAISTGGAKVATGSFIAKNNEDINISLGFQPTKVLIYLMSYQFFGEDEMLGLFENEVLYAEYDESDSTKIKIVYGGLAYEEEYDEYYDETYTNYYFQLSPYQMSDGLIYPHSNGFKARSNQSSWSVGYLSPGERYMYIALG